ncbi:putative holin [Acinetobacter proteolyticus]|uniref:Phage-related membrane protein n=1 Tax=Acinetobacter proteolyticus TaxID=1776741 RepID=A0A2N0WIB6_9GAMM|nr:putative holin [Acinetobacter proteolyticus]MBK5647237.1 hypothetical protein [Acinetobacter sp.]PKF35560.1 hypothetical protein CW311_04530 [Acinetobacter proteolyticus]
MTEPASASGLAYTMGGVGLVSLLPFVNTEALIGAALGAAVVAIYTQNVRWYRKLLGFFISVACGYFFAPEAKNVINFFLSKFWGFEISSILVMSCLVSIVSIPFLMKFSDWAYKYDLGSTLDEKTGKRSKKDKESKGE